MSYPSFAGFFPIVCCFFPLVFELKTNLFCSRKNAWHAYFRYDVRKKQKSTNDWVLQNLFIKKFDNKLLINFKRHFEQ